MEIILLLLSLLSFFGYMVTNRMPYTRNLETWIDKKIGYYSIFVIPYLGLFPFIIIAYYYLASSEYNLNFLVAIIIANVSAAIFWYFYPTGVRRYEVKEKHIFAKTLNFIYQHDGDVNGFPSGHVFVSLICSYFLYLSRAEWWSMWVVVSILITLSIVFTKQHYVVDILGGVMFAIASIILGFWIV